MVSSDSPEISPSPISPELSVGAEKSSPRRNRKLLILFLLSVFSIAVIFSWNELALNRHVRAVTSRPGNEVVTARAHYKLWVDPSIVIFDITGVAGASKLDVFRVLLQFAEEQKDHQYSEVILCKDGDPRFVVEGAYFQQLGEEYSSQNPMYTIRTFPAHVSTMEGRQPYGEYEGGILAVLAKEMDQFSDMMDAWLQ